MKKFINKIKNNKVLSILSVLIIGLFFILVTRITYAYLAPVINDAQTNVVGSTDTVDDFKFELGNPLKINATPTTLKENGTNYTTSTTAKALLKANSTKKTATFNYYVYFQIKSNTFIYSDGSTPEIILTVTSPNGDEITSIDGLTYGTFNGVSGFDITTKKGLFNIANNHEITSNSSTTYTTQSWTIKITYLNLSIDQSANFGNSMGVNVYITKNEKKPTVADICSSEQTLSSCIIAMDGKDDTLYHHTSTLTNGAGDNSYRYAGSSSSVNNYICFGSYEATCPEDNLYRIIGVFGDKVKVVKYRDIGSYNTSKYNATSFTGTEAYTALNSTFIGTLGDEWQNMIYLENWISGEISSSILSQTSLKNNTYKIEFLAGSVASPVLIDWYTAKVWYTAESNAAHTLSMKIGTISISELRYAMNSSNWNLSTLDNTSWLYYSKNEAFYLFNSFSSGSGDAFGYYMTTDGTLYAFNEPSYTSDNTQITTYVRPSFYLTSSVTYVSGDGTQNLPFRIEN